VGFRVGIASVAVLTALFVASSAAAQTQPVGPWDGSNPFRCKNQDVGTGTDFPFPNADPFCVEFDKTQQNITDFGIVQFLLNEPARTLAAVTKCFYYQQDHWTGSIVQGQPPELWHWDGQYFFDRAKGTGGVAIHNFRLAGEAVDIRPYVPPAFKPYFYPTGGGGVRILLETHPDPICGAKVDTPQERRRVYRGGASAYPRCIAPGGEIGRRHVGSVSLGERRRRLLHHLGRPRSSGDRVDRWCVVGGYSLRVAYSRSGRVELAKTTVRGQSARGVGPGDPARAARRKLLLERGFGLGGTQVFRARRWRGAPLYAGITDGRVRWLALTSQHADARSDLRRTP
jgi:hypothetical protein